MTYKVDFKYLVNGDLMSGSFTAPNVNSSEEAKILVMPHIEAFLARVSGSLYEG